MTRKQRWDTAWLLIGIPAMALALGFLTRSAQFSNAFYETVAQVIPVFLLAVAVEQQVFRDDPSADPDIQFGRRALLIVAVIGEAICLAVIAYGDDPLLLRGAVLLTLLGMGAMFVLVAIYGPPSNPSAATTKSTAKLNRMELPVLAGERLTLRPLTDDDVEILLPAIYEPGTVEWWGDTSDADYQREGLRNKGNAFAIVVGDEVAGWLSFDEEPEPDYREVGFDILLRPEFQRQGLGADALRLLIRWFIEARGHHRFSIDP
ncbi:MAG TPA: GNAT family N-acetyltransferase, partial [Thermoleophilaceae bacterium]|nr:GNAT family N-acetyltransferase [Thermoleophilaceae bacterium]